MKSRLVHKGGMSPAMPAAHPRGTVAPSDSIHKGSNPKKVGEGRVDPSQKGQVTGLNRDARAEHGATNHELGTVGISAPLATRQSNQRADKNNSVMAAGEYAGDVGSTLHTPGSHAPALCGPNTIPRFATGSNGVNPGSPVGPEGTFEDNNHPFDAEGKDFDARAAARRAVSNLRGADVSRLSRPK